MLDWDNGHLFSQAEPTDVETNEQEVLRALEEEFPGSVWRDPDPEPVSVNVCAICGESVEGSSRAGDVYHRVAGWERDRAAGGTNMIRLRQRTGEVAHRACVEHPRQGTILG